MKTLIWVTVLLVFADATAQNTSPAPHPNKDKTKIEAELARWPIGFNTYDPYSATVKGQRAMIVRYLLRPKEIGGALLKNPSRAFTSFSDWSPDRKLAVITTGPDGSDRASPPSEEFVITANEKQAIKWCTTKLVVGFVA